jgi:hypothetical protein
LIECLIRRPFFRGMVAIIFVEPDGAVEAFHINGLTSMGRFATVAEAAARACADADEFRDF